MLFLIIIWILYFIRFLLLPIELFEAGRLLWGFSYVFIVVLYSLSVCTDRNQFCTLQLWAVQPWSQCGGFQGQS